MAKSEGNFLTLNNALLKQNINPLAYRFSALQVHYRKPMEYSEEGIKQAGEGFASLLSQVAGLGEKLGKIDLDFKAKFLEAINDDLNMPQALAVVAAVLKSKLAAPDKLKTILDFDKVLGLNLALAKDLAQPELKFENLASDVQAIIIGREVARSAKNWEEADRLREELKKKGYLVEDIKNGFKISKL